MKTTISLFLVFVFHFTWFAQDSSVKTPTELMLSFSPVNLILSSGFGIGPKIELETKRNNYSIKLEGLKYIDINRNGNSTLFDDRFEYNNGFQIGTAVHRWFNNETFVGFNFNYKKQDYVTSYGLIYASTYNSPQGLSSYSSILTIDKEVFMFHLSAGARVFIFNNFFVKPEFEIGIRYRNVDVTGLRSPDDELTGLWLFADEQANGIRFSMMFDIKIGYQFKW